MISKNLLYSLCVLSLTFVSEYSFAQTQTSNSTSNLNDININTRWNALNRGEQPALENKLENQQNQINELKQNLENTQNNKLAEQSTKTEEQEEQEDRPPVADTEIEKILFLTDSAQEIRQSGQKLEHPLYHGFAFDTDIKSQQLLQAWKAELLNFGLPLSKINFEAKRLSQDEFQMWASRFIWWEEQEHPNMIDVSSN